MHMEIRNDSVDFPLGEFTHPFLAVVGKNDGMPLIDENISDEYPERQLIIDNKNIHFVIINIIECNAELRTQECTKENAIIQFESDINALLVAGCELIPGGWCCDEKFRK